MLKTVSSVANALGALNYKGTWNASTNTPTLASGVGTQGDYYVVSVAGATDLDGITNWGVGDWAAFNGSVWQRVEGGADGNFVNLDVTGTSNLAAIAGTGNVVLGNTVTNPASNYANQQGFGWNDSTKVLELSSSAGALQLGRTSGGGDGQVLVFRQASNVAAEIRVEGNTGYFKPSNGGGIDFSATAGTGTSEILDDYEEGAFLPVIGDNSANLATMAIQNGRYTKIGNLVNWYAYLSWTSLGSISGLIRMNGLPFTSSSASNNYASVNCNFASGLTVTAGNNIGGYVELNQAYAQLTVWSATTGTPDMPAASLGAAGSMMLTGSYEV